MLPICGPCHQRRTILISPLTVRTRCDCRPLFASRLPVVGWCGGGKSGFRRIDPLLHGTLKDLAPHLRRKVAHLLFAAGDPLRRPAALLTASITSLANCSISCFIDSANCLRRNSRRLFPSRAPCVWNADCKHITQAVYPNPADRASRNCHAPSKAREVILVSYTPNAGGTAEAWRDLATRIAQGSTAVFLGHDVFAKGGEPLGWLPLANKGRLERVSEWNFPQVYPKDEWAKRHPLFDGLPSGGLMDYTFYREIIPDVRYTGQDTPDEAVAGAFRTSHPGAYCCDLMLSVYKLGEGRIILNSLRVRQELGQDPTAERLLRNMLRYAAKDSADTPARVAGGFRGAT